MNSKQQSQERRHARQIRQSNRVISMQGKGRMFRKKAHLLEFMGGLYQTIEERKELQELNFIGKLREA